MNFNFHVPTNIIFGPGKLSELKTVKLPGEKALLVTSTGSSVKKYGYLERVLSLLSQNHVDCVLFDKIKPNPFNRDITEGARLAVSEKCQFIIALGGGSCIDSAKAIAVLAKNGGDFWDYIPTGTGKRKPVLQAPLPVVVISTTAGTGSEVDSDMVISNEETNEKIGFGNPGCYPYLSIIDPELTKTVPPLLTAYQGFDVLFHCTEGYLVKAATGMSDIYALKGIELIAKYLPTAVLDGQNTEARTMVAFANVMAGFTQSTSWVMSEHAIEHALSGYHPDIAHGEGLIMISIAYHSHFADLCPERFVQMARAMGVKDASQPFEFIKALARLQKSCGVDDIKMSNHQVDKKNFDKYIKRAMETCPSHFEMDPAPLSAEEGIMILVNSYH